MLVVLFQKYHIALHVILYMIFPFMDSQICNSLLDLKIYHGNKYIQNSFRCRSHSIIMHNCLMLHSSQCF